ncbi:5-oxoprolinase subunit PxpB [Opitutus sp. ER46]|uniref:5-oxoprolinase subunit PxpB n=1 Tax=Opitutus sp. ER46 TaxID=2161864 RepID=UPI000D31C46F|nr:5-oxoprolinase subunit PxpB [Opitutus sp. ER46]PTX94521.1 hypothetical protein DB354_12335 [Opitutus sp. ER46]
MTLSPLGDSALVLSLGTTVDDATLARVRAVTNALQVPPLPGVVDVVPAFATVTVFFDVAKIGAYDGFVQQVNARAERAAETILRASGGGRTVEIAVCYGGEYGPDLSEVAHGAGVRPEQVIAWHTEASYRVNAIGFVPGFAYLGGLPVKLHLPRRRTPRPKVPAGAVGIGGDQTGVYPLATPGGWNLIGRTPQRLFDPTRAHPALLHAGDRVRFRAITPEEFVAWK